MTPKGEAEVLVVNGEKKIEKRTIKISGTFKGQWVVTEGLTNGDAVVVMGGAKVTEGQAVEVKLAGQTPGPAPENSNAQNQDVQNPNTQAQNPEAASQPAQNPSAPTEKVGQNSVMAPKSKEQEDEANAAQKEAESMADGSDSSGN